MTRGAPPARWPPRLRERLPGPELMDAFDEIGGAELEQTLRELAVINRRLGGHSTTWHALDELRRLARAAGAWERSPVTIADVGGGGGDGALAIVAWARARGVDAHVTVLDLHPDAIAHARRVTAGEDRITCRVGDAFALEPASFDVVHAALFLHHFDGPRAADALRALARAARTGVALNDLRRGRLPWMLIRWLTAALSRSRLIRHDAPLSVARAFAARDWGALGPAAGLELTVRRCWAWRWAVAGVPA